MTSQVLIVGGGLAGLSAAAVLAERGLCVTLLESRPRLGGRAGSFLDKETGESIDTCQHVAMGCCTNLLNFCRMVGIDDLFREEQELTFIGPAGQRCRFRAGRAPAPLHLAPALMGLRFLTWSEKLRLARDLRTLAHARWAMEDDVSFADWLKTHGRTADLRPRFWDLILVSALSETAERIAVPFARQVFVDGFLGNRIGWSVHVPTVPLDELYGQHLTNWLTARGASVRTQTGVARLEDQADRVVAARLRSGERIEADEFIVAVPWYRLLDVLPPTLSEHPQLVGVRRFETAPISSVHLWFDRPVIDVPHAVLVGRRSQWVFARPQGRHSTLENSLTYLQVVISASREVIARPQAEIVAAVTEELAEIWPQVNEARLVRSRMVTDHRAVFSPLPGVEDLRPPQQSPIGNLQLAGDWTRTGWPATMESAVRSGFLAAENVLNRMGRKESLVRAKLPVGRLARWIFGLDDEA